MAETEYDEDEHPELTLSVVSLDIAEISTNHANGWGEKAIETQIHGKVVNLQILKKGDPQIGIQIQDNGGLIITDYGGMCFKSIMPQNFHLYPASGWDKRKVRETGNEKKPEDTD